MIENNVTELPFSRSEGEESSDEAKYIPVLRSMQAILEPAEGQADERIEPNYALRIVNTYPGLGFGNLNDFRDRYFSKIIALRDILDIEVAAAKDAMEQVTTAEEDVNDLRPNYLNILLNWQLQFAQWEKEWDTAKDDAAVEIAALGEAHKMFFGTQQSPGLTNWLNNIQLQLEEADQEMIAEAIIALQEAK